ncbi:hypothetical protein C0Q70_13350 [Pomacea canaliculata]|uniref:Uncharacterized protein n=1 Tax=Pomacea canaliculata TaxID=400727 RepID=A0A2T7NWZ1_POMCA|nr:hypothetical protein C0Q70_13350 [Pomacea canaliculata]
MDLNQAKEAFELLLHSVRPGATRQFIAWLEDRIEDEQLMMEKEWSRQDKILDSIREDIRGKLPLTAMSDTETIHIPQYKNLNPKTTVHVDAFLYDDDFVERLCEEGKMSRNVCTQCGSHDTQPLRIDVMKWLRPVDLSDKLEEARILLKKTDDADELDKIYLYQVQ